MTNRPTFDGIQNEGHRDIGAGTEDIGAGNGSLSLEEDWGLFRPTFGG